MAYVPIQTLIDKKDNFEIVRDQIAFILINESVNQMTLASGGGKDPELWRLNLYAERAHPWAKFQDAPTPGTPDAAPIVNIWYDNGSFNGSSGDIMRSQKHSATYNIDCYGYGIGQDDGGTGQIPGDLTAALESQRAARLVRNILMASNNMFLQLPDINAKPRLISKRWVQSISSFQPQIDAKSIQNVLGTRIAFNVEFIETSPQYDGVPLEEIEIGIFRQETGELYTEILIDFLNP